MLQINREENSKMGKSTGKIGYFSSTICPLQESWHSFIQMQFFVYTPIANLSASTELSYFRFLGSIFNCVLPEALKISAVQHDHKGQGYDDSEKRRLRSTFSCLSSISMRQRQLSTSSLFLQSPLKGCLPTWELRRSMSGSLKVR